MHHLCREIRIPISWGTLAGKYWAPSTSIHKLGKKSGALALHGIHDNAGSFDPLIQFLPRDMTLLALDLPGHGFSDHYNQKIPYRFTGFISDILEVLTYLAWKRPILIGHSFGGILANILAAILQSEISKLVIIEGMYVVNMDDVIGLSQSKVATYAQVQGGNDRSLRTHKTKLYSSITDVAESIFRRNEAIPSLSYAEVLATRSCKEVDGRFVLTRDVRIKPSTYPLLLSDYWDLVKENICSRHTTPALFINGNKSPYKFEEWMERDGAKLSPTSQLISLDGGHMVHMNSPSQLGKIMREFVTQRITSKL